MASGESMNDEYQYFHTFVEKSNQKCSHDENLNFIQLQAYTFELLEKLTEEGNGYDNVDQDCVTFHCSHIMALLFGICQDIKTVIPCLPSIRLQYRFPEDMNMTQLCRKLFTVSKDLATFYAKSSICAYDRSYDLWLQEAIYDYGALIWKISETDSIHDLMSLKIQLYSHYHVLTEKYHAQLKKPFMLNEYRSKSIIGWKYFWNPKSTALLELLALDGHQVMRYGVAYSLDDATFRVQIAILRKLYYGHKSETDLVHELCNIFQFRSKEINIRDRRTLLWPVLQHLYCLPFEDLWNEKHGPRSQSEQRSQSGSLPETRTRERSPVERSEQEIEETTETTTSTTTLNTKTTTAATTSVPTSTLQNSDQKHTADKTDRFDDGIDMDCDDIDLETLQLHFIVQDCNGPGF